MSLAIHAVVRTSLSCDPTIQPFMRREAAVDAMRRVLIDAGWPNPMAADVAQKGSSVLVADDGDSDEIRIVTLDVVD